MNSFASAFMRIAARSESHEKLKSEPSPIILATPKDDKNCESSPKQRSQALETAMYPGTPLSSSTPFSLARSYMADEATALP